MPKAQTQLVSYRLPVQMFRELKALSRKSGQTMSAIAIAALRLQLRKKQ